MIFRKSYRNIIRNQTLAGDGGNWSADFDILMNYLGITNDDLKIRGKNSLKEVIVYTCIKLLSESLAKLPLKIYQDNNGIKKATDHYLYKFLSFALIHI